VAEVRFCVFAPVRQLVNVSQVRFARLSADIDLLRWLGRHSAGHQYNQTQRTKSHGRASSATN